ncbi:hypothetical protein ABZ424_21960 [Streptomyces sp. NPDC005790]|uniref:hypothetical protein n=1 Tax=Streptomyces sp. NPDC005790 TaxID=3154777 RepID=UPI0033C9CA39
MRLTEVRNPQGLTWSYTYDAAGRLVSRTIPLGDLITTAYDACGRVVAKDVSGQMTHYVYDGAGRLVRALSPDCPVVWEFSYDAAGNRGVVQRVEAGQPPGPER